MKFKKVYLFIVGCLLVFIWLIAGVIFYAIVEGIEWVNGLYYCTMIITTVGHTDFIPKTMLGKWFTMFYTFSGTGLYLALIACLASALMQILKKFQ